MKEINKHGYTLTKQEISRRNFVRHNKNRKILFKNPEYAKEYDGCGYEVYDPKIHKIKIDNDGIDIYDKKTNNRLWCAVWDYFVEIHVICD